MSKIKEKYEKYKSEVICSIIVSFIIYLGKSLFSYLKDTGSKFIDLFSNYIYYRMGRVDSLSLIEYIIGLILGIIICCFIFIYVPLIFKSFRKKDNNKKNIKKTDSIYKNPKFKIFISIVAFLDVFFMVAYPVGIIYCLDSKHDFDLKMTALKPYITEEKYDLLYSEWVSMYGKKDYKKIQKELFNLRCKYLIKNEDIMKVVCK